MGVRVVCVPPRFTQWAVPRRSPQSLEAGNPGRGGGAGGRHRPLSPTGSAAGAGRGLRPSPRARALWPLAAGGPRRPLPGRPLFTSRRCGKQGGGCAPSRRSPPAAGPGPSLLPRGAGAGSCRAGCGGCGPLGDRGPSVTAAPR